MFDCFVYTILRELKQAINLLQPLKAHHPNYCFAQEKLILAAKARIRRMVQAKKKRTDLATPDWLKQEWEKGTEQKDLMADTLLSLNWDKAWETYIWGCLKIGGPQS